MTTESTQEKRARLLGDSSVQERIRWRSYEIYQTRVRSQQPGNQFTDWFQAENEILEELLAQEIDPRALLESEAQPVAFGGALELEIVEPLTAPIAQLAEVEEIAPKKKARSSAAKPATPRKAKAKAEVSEGEKKAAKKVSSKKTDDEKPAKKSTKKAAKPKKEE
ncbi:MAG TPA: hypothetical protein VNO70_23195 [Blastocatellia bacterium]|nr:hypothetical protein [Blastocatellia bacterium]